MSTNWIYIVTLIVALALNALLASNASDIANDKGYDRRTWFHMCCWLWPLAYVIVAAMPDKTLRARQDETNRLLKELITACSTPTENQSHSQKDDLSTHLPEL